MGIDANTRRLISAKALVFQHQALLAVPENTDECLETVNNIARTFLKTKKLLLKKNIKVEEDLIVYSKKDWKKLCKCSDSEIEEVEEVVAEDENNEDLDDED